MNYMGARDADGLQGPLGFLRDGVCGLIRGALIVLSIAHSSFFYKLPPTSSYRNQPTILPSKYPDMHSYDTFHFLVPGLGVIFLCYLATLLQRKWTQRRFAHDNHCKTPVLAASNFIGLDTIH